MADGWSDRAARSSASSHLLHANSSDKLLYVAQRKNNCQLAVFTRDPTMKLTLDLIKVSVSVINLTIAVGAVVDGSSSTQANCNADQTGEYDEQTAHGNEHDPRQLHAEYQIIRRI